MKLEDKKLLIRADIFSGLSVYKDKLAGKYFLYVFDNRCIEVFFGRENFKHLTGVDSYLNGENFYSKAEKQRLTTKQFWFNSFRTARNKCGCLSRLSELVSNDVILLEEIKTDSCTYSFGTTNLDFSVGFAERTMRNKMGEYKTIPHQFVPKTLRAKDKFFEKSKNVYEVDYIFSKDNDLSKYDSILYTSKRSAPLPDSIKIILDESIKQ